MNSIELKIKAKHLATEPAIIRCEERKLKAQLRWLRKQAKTPEADALSWKLRSISNHRRTVVRDEARATHLARTFLAGQDYKLAEAKREPSTEEKFWKDIMPRTTALANKYSGRKTAVIEAEIRAWIEK